MILPAIYKYFSLNLIGKNKEMTYRCNISMVTNISYYTVYHYFLYHTIISLKSTQRKKLKYVQMYSPNSMLGRVDNLVVCYAARDQHQFPVGRTNAKLLIIICYIFSFLFINSTICPRSSDPFHIVTYYIKWITNSWTQIMQIMQ